MGEMNFPEVVVVLSPGPQDQSGDFPNVRDGRYVGGGVRMEAATKAFLRYPKALFIVVGGDLGQQAQRATDQMARYLTNRCPGILIKKVSSLPCTRHNLIALFTKAAPALYNKRVALLTNAYHLPRALAFWERIKSKNFPNIPSSTPLSAESLAGIGPLRRYPVEYARRVQEEQSGLAALKKGVYADHCLAARPIAAKPKSTWLERYVKNFTAPWIWFRSIWNRAPHGGDIAFSRMRAYIPYGLLALVLLVAGIVVMKARLAPPKPPVPADLSHWVSRSVSFMATDQFVLSGTFWPPAGKQPAPAIILVHEYGGSRHDFDRFIPVLLSRGYAVLAYDTRGFGESKTGAATITDTPKDIAGAVAFVKKQSGVDGDRIAVIGASIGANEALVAAAVPGIAALVLLSPANSGSGLLLGNHFATFAPSRLLVASNDLDRPTADVVFALAQEPKLQMAYPGAGRGAALLLDLAAQKDIMDFLSSMLQ